MNTKNFIYILLISACFLIPPLLAVPVGMIPDMEFPYDGSGNHTHFSPLVLPEKTHPRIDNHIPIVSGSVNISQNVIQNHAEIKKTDIDSTADQRIYPKDLIYRGAFRVPMPDGEEYGWAYGGGGLSYYPKGDTDGPNDGYLGSLFGMGHDQRNYVTEITIPKPKISSLKRVSDLNTARTLQSFKDLNAGIFTDSGQGAPLKGDICYLPRQGSQNKGKLYFTFAEHMEYEQVPSHAWSELTLSTPSVKGPWKIGSYSNFCTNDYLFEIPNSWASVYIPGYRLATGRFRDGSLGGSGPSLIAIAPWMDGNPPVKNSRISHVKPLLLYQKGYEGSSHVMKNYTNADEWSGGAWITSGSKSGVVFAGTKGYGSCWYGFADGTVWPDDPPYPPIPDPPNNERGWWADRFQGVLYFYDTTDLAKVAKGMISSYAPQPYAKMNIDPYLFNGYGPKQKRHVGGVSFDRAHGYLFITEFRADGDACLIHVWQVAAGTSTSPSISTISPLSAYNSTTWPVTITGTNFRSGVGVSLKKGTILKTGTVVSLSGTKISCKFSLSGAPAGLYNLTIKNSDGTRVTKYNAFTIKRAGPKPIIGSINPTSGYNSGNVSILIPGKNFRSGASVTLRKGSISKKGIVTSRTSTQIKAKFPLTNVPVGEWNLTVRNTDGTSVTRYRIFKTNQKPGPSIKGIPIFPADHIWNVPIDNLPVHSRSAEYVKNIGLSAYAHPDFGSGLWEGKKIGFPYIIVPGTQPKKRVIFEYSDESDPGPYPIPSNPPIEGGSDHHMLIIDKDNKKLYELYAAEKQTDGSWHAGSGAIFNLTKYSLRPAGWTSADAAGLAILPGLVRYDEVAAGEIRHAIRFTAPSTQKKYVWPGRHYASDIAGLGYPPMGQRFRLKKSFNTAGYPPQTRIILNALKKYGMILADNGAPWYLSGVPDERWDNDDLHTLQQVKGLSFEAVDTSTLMKSQNSGQVNLH